MRLKFSPLLNFLFFSNIWIALSAFCLAVVNLGLISSSKITSLQISEITFVGLTTFLSYNFQNIFYKENLIDSIIYRHQWQIKNKKKLIVMFVLCGVLASYLFLLTSNEKKLILIPLVLISLSYNNHYFSFLQLRKIPALKIFLISLSWSIATVSIVLPPTINYFSITHLLIFLKTFFLIMSLTILFDIRDLERDNAQLKTIPQVYGIVKSKIFAMILLISFLILSCYLSNQSEQFIPATIVTMIGLGLISIAKKNGHDFFYLGLVDGLLVLYGGFYLLIHAMLSG